MNLTLWESGACLTYLAQQYDKTHKVSYAEGNDVHHVNQWLHFQISGQGPYYGQAAWYVFPTSPLNSTQIPLLKE